MEKRQAFDLPKRLIAIEKTLLGQAIHTSWANVRDALKTQIIKPQHWWTAAPA
jgi:hypothetical protein